MKYFLLSKSFLDLSHEEARQAGRLNTRGDLVEAIIHGAVKRVRPKAMTVFAALIGLLPIMWSTRAGAEGTVRFELRHGRKPLDPVEWLRFDSLGVKIFIGRPSN